MIEVWPGGFYVGDTMSVLVITVAEKGPGITVLVTRGDGKVVVGQSTRNTLRRWIDWNSAHTVLRTVQSDGAVR